MIGLIALVAAFVIAQNDAHRFDRSVYGVTRNTGGDLAVVVSPCSGVSIGFVTVGVRSGAGNPEIAFSAEVARPSDAVNNVPLANPPATYAVFGGPPDDHALAVIWNLRGADGTNLLLSPFEFSPSEVSERIVLVGNGKGCRPRRLGRMLILAPGDLQFLRPS